MPPPPWLTRSVWSPPEEAQVTLLRVVERTIAQQSVDPLDWHLQRSEAQAYLEQTSELLKEYLPSEPEIVLLEGRAADRIVDYAQSEGFDFLVFTSHGRGGLTGWNMSSVASKIAVRAATSMLLVRPSAASVAQYEGALRPVRYRRILVPLDGGTPHAEHVLPMAGTRWLTPRGRTGGCCTWSSKPELIQRMPLTDDEIELVDKVVQRNQRQAIDYFDQLGSRLAVHPQTRGLIEEDVASALHHFVDESSVDLVVLSAPWLYRAPAVGLWQPGDQLPHPWQHVHAHHAGHDVAGRPNDQVRECSTYLEGGYAQLLTQTR